MTGSWPSEGIVRIPAADEAYWSPEEIMSSEEREAIVLAKLRRQVAYAWECSPFYRRLWAEAGVDSECLRSLSDLVRFPLITKFLRQG